MRSLLLACSFALLASAGCKSKAPEPSLLDKEFEAYRLDRDERRMDDLKARGAKAKVEADRLETELAALMRRIREAKAQLPDARAEAESLPAAPPPAPLPVASVPIPPPVAVPSPSAIAPVTPFPLPPPEHRTAPAAPR